MATLATQRGRLYHDALLARDIEVIAQDEPELTRTHEAIFAVKAGRLLEAQRLLRAQVERLLAQADAVVLGCTELGLVLEPGTLPAGRVIDAADMLAGALAAKAYGTYCR